MRGTGGSAETGGADFVFPPHRVEEVPHGPGRVGAVHEAEGEAAGPAHGARDEGRMDAAAQFGELHEPALLSAAVEDGHVVVAVEVEHADGAAVPADVRAEGIEAHVQPADAADFSAMTAAWQDAVSVYGEPDLVFYNVGVTAADVAAGDITAETLLARYAADTAGAYHCVRLAATESFAKKGGAILITGGGFALSPSAAYLPLSMDKAALRAMVLALAPALKERGIYLGTVQVTGVIGGSERFMPETIARKFLELYDARDAAELVY